MHANSYLNKLLCDDKVNNFMRIMQQNLLILNIINKRPFLILIIIKMREEKFVLQKHCTVTRSVLTELHDENEPPKCGTPKTNDCKQISKVFSPFMHNYDDLNESLKSKYQQVINKKDRQIQELSHLCLEKQLTIEMKNMEIKELKQKINQISNSCLLFQTLEPNSQCLMQQKYKSLQSFSSLKNNHLSVHTKKKLIDQININQNSVMLRQQIGKINQEIFKTSEALCDVNKLVERQKEKKYQFYNQNFSKNNKQKQFYSATKHLDQTRHFLQESTVPIENNYEQEQQQNSSFVMSMDLMSDSRDTTNFIEDVLNDHHSLKQALIDLQEQTKQQMQEMKDYYQNQIRNYIEQLNCQRQKIQKFKLNSTRINILAESADNQQDLQQIKQMDINYMEEVHSLFDDDETTFFEE